MFGKKANRFSKHSFEKTLDKRVFGRYNQDKHKFTTFVRNIRSKKPFLFAADAVRIGGTAGNQSANLFPFCLNERCEPVHYT